MKNEEINFSDYLDYVLQPLEDNRIWSVIDRREPDPEPEPGMYLDNFFFDYADQGFEISANILDESGTHVIDSIFIFPNGTDPRDFSVGDYQPFQGILPNGIEKDDTPSTIIDKLGQPDNTSSDQPLVQPRPWIKYYPTKDIQLMIEFQNDQIWQVVLSRAFR